jgi:hypothetical protein
MYTRSAFWTTLERTTRKIKKLNDRRPSPMKALLRTSIIGLLVFAGYAAVATDISKPHSNAAFPQPCPPRPGMNSLSHFAK